MQNAKQFINLKGIYMVKIDLITGFLGAGKTTFLKKYAKYCIEQGENIGILENDFGAVNVDMMLLQDLTGDYCDLEMVAGGCDYDCHKRRFKTKLIAMGMCGYDRVIVEPSGIYDVDEFFDVLCEDPIDRWYEIGNVIAIVDSNLEKNLTKQSEYLLASQISQAGMIVFSKLDATTSDGIKNTINQLNEAVSHFSCNRKFQNEILVKNWDSFTNDDFAKLTRCGYTKDHLSKLWFDKDDAFSSIYFMNLKLSKEMLITKIKALFSDSSFGNIFRIKGFLSDETENWLELNATKEQCSLTPISVGQEVIIVIGEDLNEERIQTYFSN